MSTLAEIEEAVSRLSLAELEHLEGHLKELRQKRASTLPPARTNLEEFARVLKLHEDPLEWQRQVRGEWG